MGRSLDDVRGVVLTHGDSDHIGFAERLRREHGVPVYVHEADAARARGEVSTKPEWGHVKHRRRRRASSGTPCARTGCAPRPSPRSSRCTTATCSTCPGSPRIIGMPGHSPGSIAIHVPAVDAVFVGDALTTRHVLTGEHGPQPAPFTDDPREAIASLQRLVGLGATWVLPGHGTPWNGGVDEAVREVTQAAAASGS